MLYYCNLFSTSWNRNLLQCEISSKHIQLPPVFKWTMEVISFWPQWYLWCWDYDLIQGGGGLGGGALNFFSGRGVRPGFPKCGACELTFASEKGACERKISKFRGLWGENFQIWGLVRWKFPNLAVCELKFRWKLRLLRLKFSNFLKRGSCELTLLLEMGPLRAAGEAWKGGLQGRTSPYPLSRSVPPQDVMCKF